jgi:hypothetical protein
LFTFFGGAMMTMFPIVTSILAIIAIILGFILSPPFIWQFSTFYLIQMKEDTGVIESIRKARELVRGHFFFTWIVVVVTAMIIALLGLLFSAPAYFYGLIIRMVNLEAISQNIIPLLIISTTFGFLIKFIYCLFYIANSFLYYNLDEKKNGTLLLSRIDEIGNTPEKDEDQQY